jgi:hypothetical protein
MGGQGFTEPIRSGFGKVQASINAGNNANRVLGFKGLGFVIYVRSFLSRSILKHSEEHSNAFWNWVRSF